MAGYRYQVSITKQPDTGLFRVTWLDMEKCIETFFEVPDPQVMEDRLKSWKKPGNRLAAGRELFHFLDGTQGYFSSLLKKAADENLFPLVYLTAGRESGDWPFELIARGDHFLVPTALHLVRCVSQRGVNARPVPGNRRDIYAEELYHGALIDNMPRLVFLSGCRTGETGEKEKILKLYGQCNGMIIFVKNL